MTQEEIDKIINDAVADSKKQSKWHRPSKKGDAILRTRNILNWTFMAGFAAAIIIYFAMPEQRTLFFAVGFSSMAIKVVEFILRFMF